MSRARRIFPAPLAAIMQAQAGTAVTALRLEGVAPSVAHRMRALAALLKPFGDVTLLNEDASRKLWRARAT